MGAPLIVIEVRQQKRSGRTLQERDVLPLDPALDTAPEEERPARATAAAIGGGEELGAGPVLHALQGQHRCLCASLACKG